MVEKRIRNILVVGGGAAGLLAALSLRTHIPGLEVALLRSSRVGTTGVGEGSTPALPQHLHGFLNIPQQTFHDTVKPTWKLGLKFTWGKRDRFFYSFDKQASWKWNSLPKGNGYYVDSTFLYASPQAALMETGRAFHTQENGDPYIDRNVAYHVETRPLLLCLEATCKSRGVKILEGDVVRVTTNHAGITGIHLADGRILKADFYIDASGFSSLLLGKALEQPYTSFKDSLFCDRAVVGSWKRSNEPLLPYTHVSTMNSGWRWQIEHESRISSGYVYSSHFCSDDEATREYQEKAPLADGLRIIHFPSGVYHHSWTKNVVAIGNASGFVEPLEATALSLQCDLARLFCLALKESDLTPDEFAKRFYNKKTAEAWESVRRFLALHYKFNDRLNTPFWESARHDTNLAGAEDIVEVYREYGPSSQMCSNAIRHDDLFGLEGYFTMLVGMNVPFRRRYYPSPSEQREWQNIQQRLEREAKQALDLKETLQCIRSPDWKWNEDFYS